MVDCDGLCTCETKNTQTLWKIVLATLSHSYNRGIFYETFSARRPLGSLNASMACLAPSTTSRC